MLDALNNDPRSRYPEALQPLLALGHPDFLTDETFESLTVAISSDHIPALIAMMTDRALWLSTADDALAWAPNHAGRALGRLHATDAAIPLLRITRWAQSHRLTRDWMPAFLLADLGPNALSALQDSIADPLTPDADRGIALEAISLIARRDRAHRPAALNLLTGELREAALHHPRHNGLIVSLLVHLDAKESAEPIERAYAHGFVDAAIPGAWSSVRAALGVPGLGLARDEAGLPEPPTAKSEGQPRERKARRRPKPRSMPPADFSAAQDEQRREKRKRQRAARRRNRH